MFKLTPSCLTTKSEPELRALFQEVSIASAKAGRLTLAFAEAQTALGHIRAELVARGLRL